MGGDGPSDAMVLMHVNAGMRAGRASPMLRNRRFAQLAKTPFSGRLLRESNTCSPESVL